MRRNWIKIILIHFAIFFISAHVQGLQCHNCYGLSSELENCEETSIDELRDKLGRKEPEVEGGIPPLTISVNDFDACLTFDMELSDDFGHRQQSVVRTQIDSKRSALFLHWKMNDQCRTMIQKVRTKRGATIITKFCACIGDFCNASMSPARVKVISSTLFLITISFSLTIQHL